MNTLGTRASAPALVPGVVIRSIRPDDARRLHIFHARLSDDTIRNRFFGPHRVLPAVEVRKFTSPAPGSDVALVATLNEEIVGVGRYNRFGRDDAAEVAFVVQDGYQGHGIGTSLLTLLARIAWDDGIHRFVADTFADNVAMLGVFLHTPEAVTVLRTRRDGSTVHIVMRVTPAEKMLALAPARVECSHAGRRGREIEGAGSVDTWAPAVRSARSGAPREGHERERVSLDDR